MSARHAPLSAFSLIAACAAPAPLQRAPLASEAQLIAAEQAPLSSVNLAWNAPVEPFTVIGNIHYVGMEGVSVQAP